MIVEIEVGHLVERTAGPPLAPPVLADEGVVQDAEEPGPQVRPLLEAIERPEGVEVGLLHQVFRVLRVAAEPQRRPVERVQIRQRLGLKSFLPLGVVRSRVRRAGRLHPPRTSLPCIQRLPRAPIPNGSLG